MHVIFHVTRIKAKTITQGHPSNVKPKSPPSPYLTSSPNHALLTTPNLLQANPPITAIDCHVSILLPAVTPKPYSTTSKPRQTPVLNFKMQKRPQPSIGTSKDPADALGTMISPQSTGSSNIRKNGRDSACSTATRAASQATSDSLRMRVRYGGC